MGFMTSSKIVSQDEDTTVSKVSHDDPIDHLLGDVHTDYRATDRHSGASASGDTAAEAVSNLNALRDDD